jgi:hypothetical protein
MPRKTHEFYLNSTAAVVRLAPTETGRPLTAARSWLDRPMGESGYWPHAFTRLTLWPAKIRDRRPRIDDESRFSTVLVGEPSI